MAAAGAEHDVLRRRRQPVLRREAGEERVRGVRCGQHPHQLVGPANFRNWEFPQHIHVRLQLFEVQTTSEAIHQRNSRLVWFVT